MPGEHELQIALATATALADEWRAKANQLLALCERLEGNLTEARAGRENWKEACRKVEQERDSRDWTGLKSERDALRAALENLSAHIDFDEPWEADEHFKDPSGINAAFARARAALATGGDRG